MQELVTVVKREEREREREFGSEIKIPKQE